MARRCDCSVVLEAFEGDPRLTGLSLAVRALWLVLVRRMQRIGEVALVYGSVVPDAAEVARLVPVSVTELETYLEPLLARGLLVLRADGALACPLLEARRSRSETARINGLKGGRPRKDGSPPQQRAMMLPIVGGAARKPTEPWVSPAKLSSSFSEEEEAKQAAARAETQMRVVTPEDVQAVGVEAAELAGLDPARGGWEYQPVRGWLQAGAGRALVCEVIGRAMARPNTPAPRGLGYFTPAILAAVAARPVAAAVVAVDPGLEAADAFNARCDAWHAGHRVGEPPIRQRVAA
ncbi:hypothetical protein [Sandarakinorhabdus sp.]|uniref:hypothetical protein n=1 Tax=Sandarakinorhabdus sp. TaxID=1916663 RepID=UPI0035691220